MKSVQIKVLTTAGSTSTRTLGSIGDDSITTIDEAKILAERYLKITTSSGKSYSLVSTETADFDD